MWGRIWANRAILGNTIWVTQFVDNYHLGSTWNDGMWILILQSLWPFCSLSVSGKAIDGGGVKSSKDTSDSLLPPLIFPTDPTRNNIMPINKTLIKILMHEDDLTNSSAPMTKESDKETVSELGIGCIMQTVAATGFGVSALLSFSFRQEVESEVDCTLWDRILRKSNLKKKKT